MNPQCDCRARHEAHERAEFFFCYEFDGWIFTTGPFRERTKAGAYFAIERGVDDHTNEPFVWHCCPFCGMDLPSYHKPTWASDATGDSDG